MKSKIKKHQYVVDGIPVLFDVNEICKGLAGDDVIGIDLETTGFSAWRNSIALVQLYGEKSGTLGLIQIADGVIPKPVNDLFTSKKRTMVVHNGVGFDLWFMSTHGMPWNKVASTGRRDISKSLRGSLRRRLGKEIDKSIEHGNWAASVLSERQIEYSSQDVISLPALYRSQMEKATGSKELDAIAMEMELVPYVAQMSINGLPLKRKFLRQFIKEQHAAIKEADAYLKHLFGPINMNSPKQLKDALHKVGIPVEGTGKEYLIPLSQIGGRNGEIIDQLLIWKHGAQRIKMYNEDWMDEHIINDWAHPHFWQCSADTTRFTSSDPNFQQIPKDSRYIIGNMPGYKIVSADYSQIEVRISAYYAQDEELIKALEQDDVHAAIAAVTFNIPVDQVTKEQRKLSKALTFTLLFGGGSSTLYNHAKMSGGSMTMNQADQLTNSFFGRFKGLARMKSKAEAIARKPGPAFIRLPNSCRRILVGPSKRSTVILNTMVQGTAAVGIKYGLLECGRRGLVDQGLGSTVHDELVAAVPTKYAKDFSNEMQEAMIVGMRQAVDVTVKVDPSIGDNWKA